MFVQGRISNDHDGYPQLSRLNERDDFDIGSDFSCDLQDRLVAESSESGGNLQIWKNAMDRTV